jgi:DNA-binding response OmpR family regulator
MDEFILNKKRVLVINSDQDALTTLEKKLLDAYPDCKFDKATSYGEAVESLESWTYDLIILDITKVWSVNLLKLALRRQFPVIIFTSLLKLPKFPVVLTK